MKITVRLLVFLLVFSFALRSSYAEEVNERDFRMAMNAFESRLYSHAHRWFTIYTIKYPQSPRLPEVLLHLGICSYFLEEYERARKELTTVLERFPRQKYFLDTHYWLGEVELSEKNYRKAIEHLAIVLDAKIQTEHDEDASLSMALVLFHIGDSKQSLEVLDAMEKRHKKLRNYDQFALQKGTCLFELQRYEEAIVCFEYLIEKSGKKEFIFRSLYWLAECYYKLERFDDAVKAYFRVRKATDDSETILITEIDLKRVYTFREEIPCLKSRRPEVYNV